MRKHRFVRAKKVMKNTQRRKLMLKRAHQRVQQRRRRFMLNELFSSKQP